MGAPIIIYEDDEEVVFNLPNKKEYECRMDLDQFNRLIRYTTCWYIHDGSRGKYIRKNYWPEQKQGHLHREVLELGKFDIDCRVIHLNRKTLDNRKQNLKEVTREEFLNHSRASGEGRIVYRNLSIHKTAKDGYRANAYIGGRQTYVASSKCLNNVKRKIDAFYEKLENPKRLKLI
ncbi:MAG: hypothetical protein ACTSXG_03445 [Alphaproteobacteria bacterium]